MIGVRRGWGGNFFFVLFAWEMMKNMTRQNKMLIAATLFSDIPPVLVDPLRPPSSAKGLSGGGEAKRERPRGMSSPGTVHPTKSLVWVSADPGVLSPTGHSPVDFFKGSSGGWTWSAIAMFVEYGDRSASGRCSINRARDV